MKPENIDGVSYKLPGSLTPFQKQLYEHLINWKWKNITRQEGIYKKKYKYDAILPKSVHGKFPLIYHEILSDLLNHRRTFPFKFHQHFNHMASSQAANINLFLPILLSSEVNDILRDIKPDFLNLATDRLYKGFRIEYWDGNTDEEEGLLGDHNPRSGTDSDIGIAYYNKDHELCLWLVEHKLTEKEFTQCGGFRSSNNKTKQLCERSFSEILQNKEFCYYQSVRKFKYWQITDTNESFFVNHRQIEPCPFRGGMNQLWRNQLLGLALENAGYFNHVYFSVIHHPRNRALDASIRDYKFLTGNNPKFSSLTSLDIINVASKSGNKELAAWVKWYKVLYDI